MSIWGAPAPGPCPCLSGEPYAACCGPLLAGEALAETAGALMRSRYTAYVLGNAEHLLRTWHPRHRPDRLDLRDAPQWTGLRIERTVAGGPRDDTGIVEFRASFASAGQRGELHEVSRFERRAGRWLYVNGDIEDAAAGDGP